MEVTGSLQSTGRHCVVEVQPDDTILQLKRRILKELLPGAQVDKLRARLQGSNGVFHDEDQVSNIELEDGSALELIPATAKVCAPNYYESDQRDTPTCIAIDPTGLVCAAAYKPGYINIYDTETTETRQRLDSGVELHSLVFSECSRWLVSGAAMRPSAIMVWDWEIGWLVKTLAGHDQSERVQVMFCGEFVMSSALDRTLKVWSIETGVHIDTLHETMGDVACVVSAGDMRVMSATSSFGLRVDNIETGECECHLLGHSRSINAVAISQYFDTAASVADDMTCRIWCLEGHVCVKVITSSCVYASVAYSAGHVVAKTDIADLLIYEKGTGVVRTVLLGRQAGKGILFSPCGCWLFHVEGTRVYVNAFDAVLSLA